MSDLFVEIKYPLNKPTEWSHTTNIKDDLLQDVLTDWVRGEVGNGADEREPNQLDIYTIRLEVDLSCDKFTLKHDCGNDAMALGIVMHVLRMMK